MKKSSLINLLGLSSSLGQGDIAQGTYISRGIFALSSPYSPSIQQFSILDGDGAKTCALVNTDLETIHMSILSEDGTVSIAQDIIEPKSVSNFGHVINLYGNTKFGHHLLVGSEGKVFYYTSGEREWNTWSVQQIINSPILWTDENFGKNTRLDYTNYNEFVSSCSSCGISPFISTDKIGQLYVYENMDSNYKTWTQSAVLEGLQLGSTSCFGTGQSLPFTFNLGEGDVRISGDNIVATTDYTHCSAGGAVLFSKRHGKWSQQQTFWSNVYTLGHFTIERDTIVISDAGATVAGVSEVGAVFVQYPNTPEYGAKPQPGVPTQWSLHQILYPPVLDEGALFGNDLSIHDNRLFIAATETSKLFYFERETVGGFWSLQQVLTSQLRFASLHDVAARTIIMAGSATIAPSVSATVIEVFESDYQWDCLIISLEDQFGDGWDTARLQITSPHDEVTYFAPHCTTQNPFELRYCPRFGTSDYQGLYHLSIIDGPKSKFFWEIQWRVYEEKTGQWYRGNHATKMDFHFDATNLQMSRRAIVNNLPLNTTCVTCPVKPYEKERPKVLIETPRMLKDITRAPTYSPAPTLGQTEVLGDAWRYLTLNSASEPWFNEQYQGTNFHISDTQGHRLLSSGTSCTSLPSICYQTIPDGKYVLRVAGDLNKFEGEHSWSFCGRVGHPGEHLNFVVKDGRCDAVSSFDLNVYCSSVLHMIVLASVELELFGVSETTMIGELSDADLEAFSDSIAGLIGHGVSSSNVKISSITNQFGHAIFDVSVGVDAGQFGGDAHDLDSLENVVSQISSLFSVAASSGRLISALRSTTVPGTHFFQNLQGVQLIQTSLTGVEQAEGSSTALVTDISPVQQEIQLESSTPNNTLLYMVTVGYVLTLFAVIGLAFFAYFQVNAEPKSVRTPVSSSSTHDEIDQSTTTPVTPLVELKPTLPAKQPKSVDATKKSQRMNTIMIADLIQMVQEEDEQLSKTMSSDHFQV